MKNLAYCLVLAPFFFTFLFSCKEKTLINQDPFEKTATKELEVLKADARKGLIPEGLSLGDPMIFYVSVQQYNSHALEIHYTVFPDFKLLRSSFENLAPCLQERLRRNDANYVFYNPSNLNGRRPYQKLPLPQDGEEHKTETKPAP